ncbi:hypothetical protein GGS21DRAFT_499562 [Xylaria nigripes]|nr:hypothetical protein GGS21DRAFT_499562 [Xylaria nigripes]
MCLGLILSSISVVFNLELFGILIFILKVSVAVCIWVQLCIVACHCVSLRVIANHGRSLRVVFVVVGFGCGSSV